MIMIIMMMTTMMMIIYQDHDDDWNCDNILRRGFWVAPTLTLLLLFCNKPPS